MVLLQVTPYASDELVLIVPRQHELAKKSSIAIGELQTLPLVSLNQVRLIPTILHSIVSPNCQESQHSSGGSAQGTLVSLKQVHLESDMLRSILRFSLRQPHEHMIYGQSSQPGYAAGTSLSSTAPLNSMLHCSGQSLPRAAIM